MLKDIKYYRDRIGLSQSELASKTGLSQGRISDFERGVRQDCFLSIARRLATALQVTLDQLASLPPR